MNNSQTDNTVLHVDLYRGHPLALERHFLRRLPLADPLLVTPDGKPTQLAVGWATYCSVSAPHTLAECPHQEGVTFRGAQIEAYYDIFEALGLSSASDESYDTRRP